MKSKRKLLEELCSQLEIVHHTNYACVCKLPSGRMFVLRDSLPLESARAYARWFVKSNCCDCIIVRPYDVTVKSLEFIHTFFDNVVEEFHDLPF